MFRWSDVVPDDERRQWALDPFASVGPLGFGMSPDEVSAALSGVTEESQSHRFHVARLETTPTVTQGEFRKFGLQLYYRQERLAGVAVDALRGPQVLVKDVALVGRVPSVLEQWMTDRAEAREPYTELFYMASGVPGSESLGVVIDVQRAGDHLITKPIFVPRESMDDLSHWLPREAWSLC
jgi:hypothetical protein